MTVYEIRKYNVITSWKKSKLKAKGGGRLQAVKSMTVPGKCSAISDGDWTVFPKKMSAIYIGINIKCM